jgi:uncharacterized protein with HEPN domain
VGSINEFSSKTRLFLIGESNWRIMKNNEEKNPKLLFVLFYVLFITILCI